MVALAPRRPQAPHAPGRWQDTVVALNALASYTAAAGQSADMAIEVVLGDFRESLRINAAPHGEKERH